MQIGPYLWIRHWLEYEYGKEYFDALLKEVISVHADPRTNEEYFCSELNNGSHKWILPVNRMS